MHDNVHCPKKWVFLNQIIEGAMVGAQFQALPVDATSGLSGGLFMASAMDQLSAAEQKSTLIEQCDA
ncbi:MAG: hypothetical protein WBA90_08795 [Albidovulum sp.]